MSGLYCDSTAAAAVIVRPLLQLWITSAQAVQHGLTAKQGLKSSNSQQQMFCAGSYCMTVP